MIFVTYAGNPPWQGHPRDRWRRITEELRRTTLRPPSTKGPGAPPISTSSVNLNTCYQPTAIDLFAGAGGTGLGFRRGGFKIVAAVESDSHAALTYSRNLEVPVEKSDIRTLDPKCLRRHLGMRNGSLDILIGCPPCQGFSKIRNGAGADDDRNDLLLHYLDFIREFRPHYAVFENVPGLLLSSHGRDFHSRLRTGLQTLGYGCSERKVNAADYGTPQNRERIIVLGGRDGEVPPFPWPTHGSPRSETVQNCFRLPWRTVADAIRRYPPPDADTTTYANHCHYRPNEDVLQFIKMVPRDGGSRLDVPAKYWLKCHQDHSGHRDVLGRLAWDRPAVTVTTGCTNPTKGRFIHPEQDRGLTAREAAALQGFPDDFVFYGSKVAIQIGNAVPPPLAHAIAETLHDSILRSR